MVEPREAFTALQARLARPGTELLGRLREIRRVRGQVHTEDLVRLAGALGWPVAAVTGAASFYADVADGRRGRREILVCEGASCFASTQGKHISRLERILGVGQDGCAADGSISMRTVRCVGFCYDSPAVLDDGRPGTGDDLGGLLDGTTDGPESADPPTADAAGVAAHMANAAGVAATGTNAAGPGTTARRIAVTRTAPPIPYASDVDPPVVLAGLLGGEEAWWVWPRVVTDGSSPDRVIAEIAASGLRGRGGAGFPVAKKWSMTAREPGPRYVIANGDEGDPGSYCDRLLMESDPHRILEGLALAAFATGARHGLVLVRSEYPRAAARMRAAVAEARAAGHLGVRVHGSPVDFDVEIVDGAGSYVAGEETALMHAVEGLRGDARPRPPYPTTHGFLGRPTTLNNVETLAAVPWVIRHSGAAYARLGHPDEPGTKLVCLSQLFRRPGVYEVEYGVPLRHLVDNLGGGLRDGHTLRTVQIGGPLGGFLAPDQLDLPLLTRPLADAGAAVGHASLIAFDTAMPTAALLRHEWAFGAAESCGACTPCRVGTRRGLELAERIGPGRPTPETVTAQQPLLDVLDAASLCAFGRGVACAVRSVLRLAEDELRGPTP